MFGSMYDVRQEGNDARKKAAFQTAQLGPRQVIVQTAANAGGMLGRGISSAMGALPQAEAKQAKINELMEKFPNPTTKEEFMALAGEFKDAGMLGEWEKAHKMALDIEANVGDVKKSTSLIRNLKFQAKQLGCDINEPSCYSRAMQSYNDLVQNEDNFTKQLSAEIAKDFKEQHGNTEGSVSSLRNLNQVSRLLQSDDGVISGFMNKPETWVRKAYASFGGDPDEGVVNSEVFSVLMNKEVGNLLATGMLGSGTGLSDSDREFAQKMVAGTLDLTEESIRRGIYLVQRSHEYNIDKFNDGFKTMSPKRKNQIRGFGERYTKIPKPEVRYAWKPSESSYGFKGFSYNDQNYLVDTISAEYWLNGKIVPAPTGK